MFNGKKFFKSVGVRISLRFTIVVAAVVLLLSVGFVIAVASGAKHEKSIELKDSGHVLAKALLQGGRKPVSDDSASSEDEEQEYVLPRFLPRLPYYITYLVYRADDNTVLYTNDPLLPYLPLAEKPRNYIERNYYIDGDLNVLYCAREMELPCGKVVIQISENIENDSSLDFWGQVLRILLLSIGPVLFISFLICLFMVMHTMKPVVGMTESAKKISSSNLEQKLKISKHGDELDELAETFNELFERLKADFDRERQFTSDVSHELKTPVAVILGQANLLRRWGKNDPAQLEKSLGTILNETKSMQAIIDNLLQMSRLESGRVQPELHPVNLEEMFARIRDETLSVAELNHYGKCSVIFDEKINLNVMADSELLHQVFTVVVSNSLKFTKEVTDNIEIKLRAEKFRSQRVYFAGIEIEDNGKGFGDSISHVFERFFREDTAHSRSAGGSGLGLSIARTIVESMKGNISAHNSEAGGAVIRIELPLSEGK